MNLQSYNTTEYKKASATLRNSHRAAKAPPQVPPSIFFVKRKTFKERFFEKIQTWILTTRFAFWLAIITIFYFSLSCFAQESKEDGAEKSKFIAMPSKFMARPQAKSPEKKLREVSEMYEKHFLREMTKAMRSTVHEGGFIQSNYAEKIFREQLDDHYVDKWSEKGGIGFSDLIYNQLVEKFGTQLGMRQKVEKPRGPLPLDRAKNFQHPGKPKSTLSYRIDVAPEIQGVPRPGARDVKAPWTGFFGNVTELQDQQKQIEIDHDNGLKSQVVFRGTLSTFKPGQKVQAGDTLGFLSSEAKSIYWTIETDKSSRPQTAIE